MLAISFWRCQGCTMFTKDEGVTLVFSLLCSADTRVRRGWRQSWWLSWSLEHPEGVEPGKAGLKGPRQCSGEGRCSEKGVWLERNSCGTETSQGRQQAPMTYSACLNILPRASLNTMARDGSLYQPAYQPASQDPELRAVPCEELRLARLSTGWPANQTLT